jgi:alkanesulfonate monooxygenase SsuD/methylene tetrahydromethanopterin reductase-like flavin-dependent oxidoreductase (luciferase family)
MAVASFGLFDWIDRGNRPVQQLYEERLQLLEAADAAGFYAYHLAEHHATPLGMASSPGLFLAAAAQRTRRIRLGPLVYLLPMYNPLRLIDEICMLDHLSGGRLDLGIGRGVSPYELAYFGVTDDASARSLFDEVLAVVLAGLTHERLTFEGTHFQYRDVPMEHRPLQQPYPPIWYPSQTPESAVKIARQGYNFVRLGPGVFARQPVADYWQTWAAHKDDPTRHNAHVAAPKVGIVRQIVVAETDDEAADLAKAAHADWFHSITKLWHDHGNYHPDALFNWEASVQHETVVFGAPDRVKEQIARLLETSGCNYVLCAFAWGTLSAEQSMRSLRLFTDEVMPAFSGDTVAAGVA